jgi:arsenate reductase (glutaredoxin)
MALAGVGMDDDWLIQAKNLDCPSSHANMMSSRTILRIRNWRGGTGCMKDKITVYEKPTCTKCREVDKILRESGVDYEKINYYVKPLSATKLRELLKKMGLQARELLRTTEPVYRELGLAKAELSDSQIVDLMVKHPDLIQRPIVERASQAVLGRPTENIQKLLK